MQFCPIKHSEGKELFNIYWKFINFFSVHFWLSSEKIQDVTWKTFNKVVKTSFYVSKRAVSWKSFFNGNFWESKFLSVERNCFLLLAGVFSRVLKFLSYVFRGKNGEFFFFDGVFSKFLAVWAIFLSSGKNHLSWIVKSAWSFSKKTVCGT